MDWLRSNVRATKAAKLEDVRIHDLRHTFGVHAAQAGVPLPRPQKLIGHATSNMIMCYAAHAPTSYFAQDAARIAASVDGTLDEESSARTEVGRKGFQSCLNLERNRSKIPCANP